MAKIFIQKCCPQHTLSRMIGWLGECRWPWFKNWAIKRVIRKFDINLSEAKSENLEDYPTFNSFFTRELKIGLRPIAAGKSEIASPADGQISQIGCIQDESLFQAKNFYFSLTSLFGNQKEVADLFRNGCYATIYLAPKDYHRVHMPLSGKLRTTIYIPGDLFSVNHYTAEGVPNLFARNERLVCIFDTDQGPMAIILVGAMLVSSIKTVWEMPARSKQISIQHYADGISLEKGENLGHFQMGSTVIVLFPQNMMKWDEGLKSLSNVKMGQKVGNLK